MSGIKRKASVIVQEANKAYAERRFQDAINGWLEALSTGKAKHPEAFHFNCATAYTNMQNFDKAIEQLDLCLKISPTHGQALSRKTAILHKTHKFEEALSGYHALLKLGNHSQYNYSQKLNLMNILERFEDTVEVVDTAVKMTKDEGKGLITENMNFNVEVAFALCKLKKVDSAYAEDLLPYAQFLEKMNKEGKLGSPAHRNHKIYLASLSRIAEHFAENDFDISYAYFSKLIDEEPENASTYFNRGVICRRTRLGMTDEQQKERLDMAVENFEKASKLSPQPAYFKGLGNARLTQKDYFGALDALKHASQRDIKVLYNTGVCYLNLRKVQDAYDAFERALKIDPNYGPAVNAHKLLGKIVKNKRQLFMDLANRLRNAKKGTPEFQAALAGARKAQKDLGFLQSQKNELIKLAAAKGETIQPVDERVLVKEASKPKASAKGAATASSSAPPTPPAADDETKGATCNFDAEDAEDKALPEIKAATTTQEKIDQGKLFKIKVPAGVVGGQRILMDLGASFGPKGAHIASVVVPTGMKESETFLYNPLTGITVDNNNVITRQRVVPVDKMSKQERSKYQRLPMAVGFLLSQSAHPYIQKYQDLLKRRDEDLDPVELEIKRAIQAIGRGRDDLADSVSLGHTKITLTLEEILGEGGRKPKDFDIYNKERYLSDDDFAKLFKMDRASFEKLKRWRRNKLKKKYGLF